jgi:hypothetical protein
MRREKIVWGEMTVQAKDCEEKLLVSRSFLNRMRSEIDDLRARLGLPSRQWESATSADAVDPADGTTDAGPRA